MRDIDGDTSVMPNTEDAALRAAGAVRGLVDITGCGWGRLVHHSNRPRVQVVYSQAPPTHPSTHQTCVAVDRVLAGEAPAAFCVVRPPGHHATPSRAMGFCFFNNAGVAALHARAVHGVGRVACVDVVRLDLWWLWVYIRVDAEQPHHTHHLH